MTKFDYEIDDFMSCCQSKGLSKKSMRSYEQTLRLFAKYLEEEKNIYSTKDVTKEAVRDYIVYLRERESIQLFRTRIAENGINHRIEQIIQDRYKMPQ